MEAALNALCRDTEALLGGEEVRGMEVCKERQSLCLEG